MTTIATIRINRPGRIDRGVEVDAEIAALLAADAPVAVGVSGGKDSCAAAIATVEHLRAIGHRGPVVLVHSDLGDRDPELDVEWADSLPTCERLAAFQGSRWLGDTASHLLSDDEREALRASQERARQRAAIEARIPKHLLYTAGWPTVMPTWEEAVLLAEVRREISALLGIFVRYTEPQAIVDRYAALMAQNAARQVRKSRRPARARACTAA